MIELIVYNYLNDVLEVPAYMERPADGSASRFVVIEKTGSGESNKLNRSVIACQCYAESLYQTAILCDLVIQKMNDMDSLPSVTSVKLNNSYNFTKTDSKEYRYQAVFEVYWYQEESNEQ